MVRAKVPVPAPGQIDPYSFQVDDADLIDRLRAWAVARDAHDRKHWWSRGHAPARSRCEVGSGVWRRSGGSAVTTGDRGTS